MRNATEHGPHAIDKHVGHRIQFRRKLLGVSQTKLGNAIGVTFQQIQKYENGTNRVGASNLYRIACALGVPVTFFYEGVAWPEGKGAAKAKPLAADRTAGVKPELAGELLANLGRMRPDQQLSVQRLCRAIVQEPPR